MRLLLIEDDGMLGDVVRRCLQRKGHLVSWVQDGTDAERALAEEVYDAVLLDLGLPRKGGLEILRDFRQRGQTVPVLITTAQDAVADRVAGLEAGADDYVVKPFDIDEVNARLHALARRSGRRASSVVEHGRLRLDPSKHEVLLDGVPVALSTREFALLRALLEQPGRPVTRASLEQRLYGFRGVESNAVEVHVHSLRRKLGPEQIKTLRGIGYMVPEHP
jgi:two-component system, OmpR family, response regulator